MLKKIINRISPANGYLLLMMILVFCVFQFGITKIYGMYLFPDEFGYWASAAKVLGYDWSEIVALGNYYSYGYSVILAPILKLVTNATSAYRVAIFINAIFLCGGIALIFHLFRRFFPKLDEKMLVFISASAMFYPSCIYYMQTTMTESLLTFLLILISTFTLHYIERPNWIKASSLAVLLCFLNFVHMRTVGIVIACSLTILLLGIWHKKYRRSCVVFMAVLACLVICGVLAKGVLTRSLYHAMSAESFATNNYGGQIGKIKVLFTVEGIRLFIASCTGKLFYLGSATFGLFYFGIGYLFFQLVELFRKIKRKEELAVNTMWNCFFLLTVILHFMVGAVYMMAGSPNGRIDALFYGRYNEILVPLMIAVGLVAVYKSRYRIRTMLLLIGIQGISAFLLYRFIRTRELVHLYTCHIAALRYAVKELDFYIPEFLEIIVLVSGGIGLLVVSVMTMIRKKQEFFWLIAVVIAVEVALGVYASRKDIYLHNEDNFRDHELAEKIEALEREENEIIYYYTGGTVYVDLLQFYLRDTKFTVLMEENELQNQLDWDDLVLINKGNPYGEELEEKYESSMESGHFEIYYNEMKK